MHVFQGSLWLLCGECRQRQGGLGGQSGGWWENAGESDGDTDEEAEMEMEVNGRTQGTY